MSDTFPKKSIRTFEMWTIYSYFSLHPVCVCTADNEKLDERAKLSVAAKRSLFRVSFSCLSYRHLLLSAWETHSHSFHFFFLCPLIPVHFNDEKQIVLICSEHRHSSGMSVVMKHICEIHFTCPSVVVASGQPGCYIYFQTALIQNILFLFIYF